MLEGLGELVPAELLTWDRVELATGAVRHEAVPAEAEPPGAFAAVVDDAAGHPLLSAHAGRWREALRLSEAVEPRRLARSGCTAICSTDPVSSTPSLSACARNVRPPAAPRLEAKLGVQTAAEAVARALREST
jgi:hypothetical protein